MKRFDRLQNRERRKTAWRKFGGTAFSLVMFIAATTCGGEPKSMLQIAEAPDSTAKESDQNSADSDIAEPERLLAPFDDETAKKAQREWAEYLKVPVEITNSVGMKLVLIPPGDFTMGTTKELAIEVRTSKEGGVNTQMEQPAKRVTITKPFYLGVHEVTRAQFGRFAEAAKYKTDAEKNRGKPVRGLPANAPRGGTWRNPAFPQEENHPVVNVSASDINAFCEWLGKKEKRQYLLPREAEWEYAARAGTDTPYYTGDDGDQAARAANMRGTGDGFEFTAPVGSFPANPFGLHDTMGNVWEMCRDRPGENYSRYNEEGESPPKTPASKVVTRGGAADCPAVYCRSASRDIGPRALWILHVGFRVSAPIEENAKPEAQTAPKSKAK